MINRNDAINALASEHFDVVVIGGGITGAGVALDAATRGYSVALVEKRDFACGTSSRSSKLVHGGLRYLENFDLGLVREALLERQLMVALAPHLVKPLKMVVPAFNGEPPNRVIGLGLNMYDVMAFDRNRLPGKRFRSRGRKRYNSTEEWSPDRHRAISTEEVQELLPALGPREPTGGYLFYDCQTDDVRLVLTVLGEAERFGAVIANRLEVTELLQKDGTSTGVNVSDRLSGNEFSIEADNVVSATGVWADHIRPKELHDEAEVPRIRPSRGTHLIFKQDDLHLNAGVIVPVAEDGRRIFALPWLGYTLVGTTDNDYEGNLEHIVPPKSDIDYLLKAINDFFATSLNRSDISGTYAGVRPLITPSDSKKSVDISRREELYETSSGLVTITGGKLTTWRRMAKLTVDRLVEREGREAPCRTQDIPLGLPIDPSELPRFEFLKESNYQHLAERYGYAAHEVMNIVSENPALAEQIVPNAPDILAEIVFAVRREQAVTVADILLRRTRLGLLVASEVCSPDSSVPKKVAQTIGKELGWKSKDVSKAVKLFHVEAAEEGLDV